MADISNIKFNNVGYNIMDAKCRAELEALIGSDTLAGDVDTIKEIQAFLNGIDTDDPTLFNQLKAINDRIDAIEAVSGTVDDALSSTSINPVQNKVIKDALDKKANKNEMMVTDVTGDTTKKTIQLKSGTSQTVVVEHQDISGKQNAISDLATIRSGASKGATAIQQADLATVATSGDYADLDNKPTIPAAQVNSDWAATSGVAQILNKPSFKTINGESIVGTGDIEAGEVKSVTINGTNHTPDSSGVIDLGTIQGEKGDKGDAGATGPQGPVGPQGPKGDSGVASGDGVVVVNDTSGEPAEITEGQVAVLGAGVGKYIADRAIPTSGTFADAYDKAKANGSVVFPWMLIDEDESGEPIKKMIWHVGNREFIDAIGAKIDGQKNGITINVSAPCRMVLNGKTFSLPAGETNISFDEIGAAYAPEPSFLMLESDDSAKSLVESIDFGGFDIIGRNATYYPVDSIMRDYPNITRIERLSISVNNPNAWQNSPIYWINKGLPTLEFLSMVGTRSVKRISSCFYDLPKLSKVDFSKMFFTIGSNNDGLTSVFSEDPLLRDIDISGWTTTDVKTFNKFCMNCRALKKFTIGNFSNANITNKGGAFANVTDCTLICTTNIPPVLKNCAFDGDTALDEYSNTYDWVAGHFSAIYVPSDAVNAYKENTYIENGTVGNTGWSKYADIIHSISEYNG